MRLHDIIKKPVVTEKALSGGARQEYVFEVDVRASKDQIKNAVESLFKGTEVSSVRTQLRKGKVRRTGRRMKAKAMPDVKRAIVTLNKGSIDLIPKS